MNIILMGPPGVGKGTQSRRLARLLNVPIVASGDMFRAMREEDTPLAREVRQYMDQGDYVPDDLTIELVLKRLTEPDAQSGFILDGFPRTVPQAQALDAALEKEGQRIDNVILLEAPTDIVTRRLSGRWICSNCGHVFNQNSRPPQVAGICDDCGAELVQRTDENPDVQSHRLTVFERQTEPVISYYRDSNRLQTINAEQSVDTIQNQLRDIINSPASI
jgi:adenylate kinase